MANKNVFKNKKTRVKAQKATVLNNAGGRAYKMQDEHALAQLACTGCLRNTYYTTGQDQLSTVLELCNGVSDEFIAKVAVYSRSDGFMKDMPALLTAVLSVRNPELMRKIFPAVINDGKMLRNFVQIIRSGTVGRTSLGSAPKKMIQNWFNTRDGNQIFRQSIGNDPTLMDVVKLAHVNPVEKDKDALFKYLMSKEYNKRNLPSLVKELEAFKEGKQDEAPEIPFLMLTALELTDKNWKEIAQNASWQSTRMNLNTFLRHKVFSNKTMIKLVAERLKDVELIKKANVFPYQLFTAYKHVSDDMPREITDALHDAMELATNNVPEIDGKVYVAVDCSGSMSSPVTGHNGTATSKVSCVDVAALVGATFLRKNTNCEVIAFGTNVVPCRLDGRDTIMTNSQKLSKCNGGGTNCSAPLAKLNRENAKGNLFVLVSDNESWIDSRSAQHGNTAVMQEWEKFKSRNPNAKMICIDLTPNVTTQAVDREDILNCGGFSDSVFDVIHAFSKSKGSKHWVEVINKIKL